MQFTNKYYKKTWEKTTKNGTPYKIGTYKATNDGYAVYDGATNYMGKITASGEIICNGAESEYKMSFLKSAKEAIG